ncbi:MAG: DUF1048 domain-containing protein [Oscillospiraceae bacterium]
MLKSIIKIIIGDLSDKKKYKQFKRRVNSLPGDYKFTFNKIQHYIYIFMLDVDVDIFEKLLCLFEESSFEGKKVIDIVGSDVAKFTDEMIKALSTDKEKHKENINTEIIEKLGKER